VWSHPSSKDDHIHKYNKYHSFESNDEDVVKKLERDDLVVEVGKKMKSVEEFITLSNTNGKAMTNVDGM